ncbi:hypothetical protein N4T20_02530 [Flavobacterium sp. TR2]|uniref:hypothetical protein n=1 Tax=Flavobacterium sp. TR2 TaxID=2977321 RepID=UPI0021B0FF46|nr:hypothetical protein [Flavobacterium sp. TR2]UWY28807.1 hypothetical protein N4T20_02530 [Flavobacterium sp. TR2]
MKNKPNKITLCLFYFSFLFLAIGTLVSCKSSGVPLPEKSEVNTITTKVVVRDTVFEILQDSSYYNAWLECKDGKVKFKGEPVATPGKSLKAPKVNIQDNQLKVDCQAEAQKLFAQWKDTYKTDIQKVTVTHTNYIKKPLTWWEKFQIFCGRVFLTLALYYLIKFLIKIFKPV